MASKKQHRLAVLVLTSAAVLAVPPAASAQSVEVIGTQITIDVIASNISAVSIPGSTSTTRLLFFKRNKDTPALEGLLEIGVVRICGNTRVVDSNFQVHVLADGISARGATLRVGNLYICP